MDRLRTLLLARAHVVVLDPELAASAATRPMRDVDADRLELALIARGYVLGLDLAMMLRSLPAAALRELTAWLLATCARDAGARPASEYAGAIAPWLTGDAPQPCPWCTRVTAVVALAPCGHLACRACWTGQLAGCPICHRRVVPHAPFATPATLAPGEARRGTLTLLQLGFDLAAVARTRFQQLAARQGPLAREDRDELEALIDAIGPSAASWLAAGVANPATRAIAVARLVLIAADRGAMLRALAPHSADDLSRIARVLLYPGAARRARSLPRALRRALLDAIDAVPERELVAAVARAPSWWKRLGEVLHPGEHAARVPNAARAFAAARGPRARLPALVDPIAHADRAMRNATVVPRELAGAIQRAAPERLFALASHVAARGERWPARVFAPRGDFTRAWRSDDQRPLLTPTMIGAVVASVRDELLARAEARRHVPRALIDRALADTCVPARGSTSTLPEGRLRFVTAGAPVALTAVAYDASWRRAADVAPIDHGELAIDRSLRTVIVARANGAANVAIIGVPTRCELVRAHAAFLLADGRARVLDARLRAGTNLAHLARDICDAASTRPTLWDVACVHAAARANVIYVRDRDGSLAMFRRRDRELASARLARLYAGDADTRVAALPAADAPTWFALVTADVALPARSLGVVLADSPLPRDVDHSTAAQLVAELSPREP